MSDSRPVDGDGTNQELYFQAHGVRVIVTTNDQGCANYIASDFSCFRIGPGKPMTNDTIRLKVSLSEPPYDRIPKSKKTWIRTKDASVHGLVGSRRYLKTKGGLLIIQDFSEEQAELYSLNRDLLLDRAYLMIMSRLGERLDRRGLHRIHAMGVAMCGRAALCLMPMGGGKTTLTLSLLAQRGFALLSDEAPLVDRHGNLHGFPIRLGVCAGDTVQISDRYLKKASRMRYGQKVLIDANYFGDRLEKEAKPAILFVGKRIASSETVIKPMSRLRAAHALWVNAVLAQGLPQLLEYIHRINPMSSLRQLGIHVSRVIACYRLLRKSECYELGLGVDTIANGAAVGEFLARRLVRKEAHG